MIKKYSVIFCFLIINQIFCDSPTKQDFNKKFIDVAKKGNPAVVSIISETITTNNSLFGSDDSLFEDFMPKDFKDMFPNYNNKATTLGSGVIIDKEKGYIITNNHVIQNAESIKDIFGYY